MNYRHAYHAGNFADVFKHALLVALIRALQRKHSGFLFIDTHAGRGAYDLSTAANSPAGRAPEWPGGIGRLWQLPHDNPPPNNNTTAKKPTAPPTPSPTDGITENFPGPPHDNPGNPPSSDAPSPALSDYLRLVRQFDRSRGNLAPAPRFYPGSPLLAALLARPQDRLALFEKHPAECAALRAEFAGRKRAGVQCADGYSALRGQLPPPEKRALALLDPPYESPDEFAGLAAAIRAALDRLPSAVLAVWHPLTERARPGAFFDKLGDLSPPPTLSVELAIAGPAHPLKLKGCGLLVLNPPWQSDRVLLPLANELAKLLALDEDARASLNWLVPEN